MNIVIIEDEAPAARRLERLIAEVILEGSVVATLSSVNESLRWFAAHPTPQLIFADIQLSDGLSFDIFDRAPIKCPIIFITAFDEYAIKAFKINSIGYLLKPIKSDELQQAVSKFRNSALTDVSALSDLIKNLKPTSKSFTTRFMIKYGATMKVVQVDEVAYFFSEDKVTYIQLHGSKSYPIDFTLEQLEKQLDPEHFFRINRQFVINIKAIDKMVNLSRSRVKVELIPPTKGDTIVSSAKSASFKVWLAS